ncbi:MAG TPA: hypothetical protein VHS78_04295 [Candidatus Elarobacter sp.]|nr:hypothetical protein [Candidatus Elarobacter sp.]
MMEPNRNISRHRINFMITRRRTTLKHIYVAASIAALAAAPAAFVSAAEVQSDAAPALSAPGTHYQLVDAHGNIVGELVTESTTRLRLIAPAATSSARMQNSAPSGTTDRTFHPDYSKALTPGQMSAAWQAEWDRISPPIITGGG